MPALFPAQIQLSALDGVNGFTLNGIAPFDFAGFSVSQAGDVNGDGLGDLIVGAPDPAPWSSPPLDLDHGEACVVFGHTGGFASMLDLDSLDGTNGFRINGIADGDRAGYSVSGIGDMNGDGFDDLVIAAYRAEAGGPAGADRGEVYVVFGHAGPFAAVVDASSLDGTTGFRFNGSADSDRLGWSVSGAGDLNDDGFDDVVIGAPFADAEGGTGADRGEAYVLFGHSGPFPAVLESSDLDGATGFLINGIANADRMGFSVNAAGDVNGDGIDDLILGSAAGDGGGTNRGEAYVLFGHDGAFADTFDLSGLNGTNGFRVQGIANGDYAGMSASGAGDVNGDGIGDLVLGGAYADGGGTAGRGQAYVVFGHGGSFSAALPLSSLDGANGFRINGIDHGDRLGRSVRGAGDVNGDGFADVILGARSGNGGGIEDLHTGEAYVVFGHGGGFSAALALSALDGENGFRMIGIGNIDEAGQSVSAAGDINGDGIDDVIVGAPFAYTSDGQCGQSYVIFGRVPLVTISAADPIADENAASPGNEGAWTLMRNGNFSLELAVRLDLSLLGASETDFVLSAATGTSGGISIIDADTVEVRFAAGAATANIVLTATHDGQAENDENVTLTLVDLGSYELGEPSSDTVTIPRNDIVIAVGAGFEGKPRVRLFNALDKEILFDFQVYDKPFNDGVRLALGDVTGDGTPDLVTAPRTGLSHIKVFDGETGVPWTALPDGFVAFPAKQKFGAEVAVGQFDADVELEIVVGMGRYGPPRVRVFDVSGGTVQGLAGPLGNFRPYRRGFKGGVRLSTVNYDGLGFDEIVTAPGDGGGAGGLVKVFADQTGQLQTLLNFQPFGKKFGGAVFAVIGDIDGAPGLEIVCSRGQSGAPQVRIFNQAATDELDSFLAYDASFEGGVKIDLLDRDGDGNLDTILAGQGLGGQGEVRLFDGVTRSQVDQFFAFGANFDRPINVAG